MTKKPKPDKPHKDYPLFAHASGQWAKKIRGKFHYFGKWDDPDAALNEYLKKKDDLLAGRQPIDEGITVKELCNYFIDNKEQGVGNGDLSPISLNEYRQTCEKILKTFGAGRRIIGLRPLDFEKLRAGYTCGPVRLSNEITRIKMVFNYAYKQDLIDRPVKFGDFKKPSRKTLRLHRAKNGPRMFQASEIRKIIKKANPQLKAMIYLGINCGLGNNDCALLAVKNIKDGWLNYPRPKTGIDRRCPLWKETIRAINNVKPTQGLVFTTVHGNPWITEKNNPITQEFIKIVKELKIHRKGLGFYALRHTFQTIGMKKDKDATKAIMGHADDSNDMSAVYNEENVSDDRLQAVVDYVRAWLNS
jgi:integrase